MDGQDYVGACHLKNYFFVITYLLEDEQELSLGMLIRLKRIYNFLCSMLVFTPFAYYFVTLRGIFMHFPELILTRCHSASSLFSAVFVFHKSYIGNILGIRRNKSQTSRNLPKLPEDQRGDR
jgi:hypothetical protein